MAAAEQYGNTGTTAIVKLFPKLEWESTLAKLVLRGEVPARVWAVGAAFATFADTSGKAYPGVEKLRMYVVNDRGVPVSEKTIDRALKWLVKNGWLRPDSKRAQKHRAKVYWLSWPGSQRDIAPTSQRDTSPLLSGTSDVPPRTPEEHSLSLQGREEVRDACATETEDRDGVALKALADQNEESVALFASRDVDGEAASLERAQAILNRQREAALPWSTTEVPS